MINEGPSSDWVCSHDILELVSIRRPIIGCGDALAEVLLLEEVPLVALAHAGLVGDVGAECLPVNERVAWYREGEGEGVGGEEGDEEGVG